MVISVISPHCGGNGNTITALFTALGLGNMKKKVLLTHTDSVSNSLYAYLGLQQFEDKTSTPTQMVKLLREGAIQSEAIPDYCKNVADNVYVFTNNKSNFGGEDMLTFSEYLVDHSDFEYIIYDFNSVESETAKYILGKSELVILNFTQSYSELDDFNKNSDLEFDVLISLGYFTENGKNIDDFEHVKKLADRALYKNKAERKALRI